MVEKVDIGRTLLIWARSVRGEDGNILALPDHEKMDSRVDWD